MDRRIFKTALLAGFFAFVTIAPALADPPPTPPTDPTARCNVIRNFEGLCGNWRPNSCMSKPGVDYWHNMAQQKTWDDYFWLCVNIAPTKDRYSHECLDFYGMNTSCPSTVEPLVEYTAHNTMTYEAMPFREETKYSIAPNNQYVAYYCGMMAADRAKVDAYKELCGETAPSACSAGGSVESQYVAYCGDKKPCQCVSDLHCGPACPAEAAPVASAAPAPGPTDPGPGGEPAPGPGVPPAPAAPGDSGVPALPNIPDSNGNDANIALGGDSKSPGDSSLGATGNGASGGKGCALSTANTDELSGFLLLSSLVFGALGWRFRKRLQ